MNIGSIAEYIPKVYVKNEIYEYISNAQREDEDVNLSDAIEGSQNGVTRKLFNCQKKHSGNEIFSTEAIDTDNEYNSDDELMEFELYATVIEDPDRVDNGRAVATETDNGATTIVSKDESYYRTQLKSLLIAISETRQVESTIKDENPVEIEATENVESGAKADESSSVDVANVSYASIAKKPKVVTPSKYLTFKFTNNFVTVDTTGTNWNMIEFYNENVKMYCMACKKWDQSLRTKMEHIAAPEHIECLARCPLLPEYKENLIRSVDSSQFHYCVHCKMLILKIDIDKHLIKLTHRNNMKGSVSTKKKDEGIVHDPNGVRVVENAFTSAFFQDSNIGLTLTSKPLNDLSQIAKITTPSTSNQTHLEPIENLQKLNPLPMFRSDTLNAPSHLIENKPQKLDRGSESMTTQDLITNPPNRIIQPPIGTRNVFPMPMFISDTPNAPCLIENRPQVHDSGSESMNTQDLITNVQPPIGTGRSNANKHPTTLPATATPPMILMNTPPPTPTAANAYPAMMAYDAIPPIPPIPPPIMMTMPIQNLLLPLSIQSVTVTVFGYTLNVSAFGWNCLSMKHGNIFCGICCMNVTPQLLPAHVLNDGFHLTRLCQLPFLNEFGHNLIRPFNNMLVHCTVCNANLFYNSGCINAHVNSLEHKQYLQDAVLFTPVTNQANLNPHMDNNETLNPSTSVMTGSVNINTSITIPDKVKKTKDPKNKVNKDKVEINMKSNKLDNKVDSAKTDIRPSAVVPSKKQRSSNSKNNELPSTLTTQEKIEANKDSVENKLDIPSTSGTNPDVVAALDDNVDDSVVSVDDEDTERYVYIKVLQILRRLTVDSWNTIVRTGGPVRYCFACDAHVYSINVATHVKTDKHRANLKLCMLLKKYGGHVIRKKDGVYHCGICNALVMTSSVIKHTTWPYHEEIEKSNIVKKKTKDKLKIIEPTLNEECTAIAVKRNKYFTEHLDTDSDSSSDNDDRFTINVILDATFDKTEYIEYSKYLVDDLKLLHKAILCKSGTYKVKILHWHGVVETDGQYKCIVCQKSVDLPDHLSDRVHSYRVNHSKFIDKDLLREVNTNALHCIICNVQLPRLADYEQHQRGDRHARRREQMIKDSLDDNAPLIESVYVVKAARKKKK